jgi:hypothetical protein
MQNNNYKAKPRRGSPPPVDEIEWAREKWLLGLRPIKKNPHNILAINQKEVLKPEKSGSLMQPDEKIL